MPTHRVASLGRVRLLCQSNRTSNVFLLALAILHHDGLVLLGFRLIVLQRWVLLLVVVDIMSSCLLAS